MSNAGFSIDKAGLVLGEMRSEDENLAKRNNALDSTALLMVVFNGAIFAILGASHGFLLALSEHGAPSAIIIVLLATSLVFLFISLCYAMAAAMNNRCRFYEADTALTCDCLEEASSKSEEEMFRGLIKSKLHFLRDARREERRRSERVNSSLTFFVIGLGLLVITAITGMALAASG